MSTYLLDPDQGCFYCHVNLTPIMKNRLINIGFKEEDFEKVPGDETAEYWGYTHFFEVKNDETFEEFEKVMWELGFREERDIY